MIDSPGMGVYIIQVFFLSYFTEYDDIKRIQGENNCHFVEIPVNYILW